jgi:hypothetical protein
LGFWDSVAVRFAGGGCVRPRFLLFCFLLWGRGWWFGMGSVAPTVVLVLVGVRGWTLCSLLGRYLFGSALVS